MKYLSFVLLNILIGLANASAQQLKVTYSAATFKGPFSGHVIVYLSKTNQEPRAEIDEPCYGLTVKNIKPGQTIVFDRDATFFPAPLSKLERGTYYVQAVWDRNLGGRNIGTSPGNLFSKPVQVSFSSDTTKQVNLICDQVVPQQVFVSSTYIKEIIVPSALLSKFHHQQVTVNAAVILPKQYLTEPNRKFPVVFNISGYGGDYHHYSKENGDTSFSIPIDTTACIKVYMDGNCQLGHSVYANSDNNGPWGNAVVKEFIPALITAYRCNGALLCKGHSSGGYTVLWLQLHYPKVFAGVNASSPDPVDFRSFERVNLYLEKPLDNTNVFENVVYRGEQYHSYDAVFGQRGKDGEIIRLYNYKTGKMNKNVLEHWKRYDFSLFLRKNWQALQLELGGKIRISVGNEDNYGLNLPVHLLEGEMKKIGATITFAYYSGTHFTVNTATYRKDQDQWLEDKYQEWLKKAH